MSKKLLPLALLSILGMGACQNKVVKPGIEPDGKQTKLALGSLEHRGQHYSIRDLMDPALRADIKDKFARDFDPETVLADKFNFDADVTSPELSNRASRD